MQRKFLNRALFLSMFSLLFPILLSAQVTVDLQLFIPNNGMIFLNDLNLTNLANAPLLFSVRIQNLYPDSKQLVLHFGIKRDNQILLDGTTEPFSIQAAPAQIYLTSQNLLSEGGQYALQNYDIGDATDELFDAILAQGKLPSGTYRFYVDIFIQENNQLIADDFVEITITSSTTLDLISPGQPAEAGQFMEIYTPLPFFQWHSTARKFRITVCEKLAINSSPPDVMNNEPRLQRIVENLSFFQYPPAGAWPLEEGKTYYWQIVALIPSSSGDVELESEIWGFKIANISNGMLSIYHQQLLNLLYSLLSDADMRTLFENGGALEGFTFTGVMLNNDRTITMEDLLAIIEQAVSDQISIDGFFVE